MRPSYRLATLCTTWWLSLFMEFPRGGVCCVCGRRTRRLRCVGLGVGWVADGWAGCTTAEVTCVTFRLQADVGFGVTWPCASSFTLLFLIAHCPLPISIMHRAAACTMHNVKKTKHKTNTDQQTTTITTTITIVDHLSSKKNAEQKPEPEPEP